MKCQKLKIILKYLEEQVDYYNSDMAIKDPGAKTYAKLFKLHLDMEKLSNLKCF